MPDTPQIPAIFGQLDNSIRQLTARLEAMQARQPDVEFAYKESFGQSPPMQDAYPSIDAQAITYALGSPLSKLTAFATTGIDVKKIRVLMAGASSYTANVSIVPAFLLVCEFSKDANFSQVQRLYIAPRIVTQATNQVVASGDVTARNLVVFEREFPLRYRCVRFSLANLTTGLPSTDYTGNVNAVLFNGMSTQSQIFVEFFGN